MSLLRKIFFYIFLVIYLVVCPMTILYALGYLFRPGDTQGIVKTGLIYLATKPEGASVSLGNRRYTEKTPTMIRNLLPGNYPVTVSLKNYKPWSQTLPVEAVKATARDKILLIPQQWKERTLLSDSFDNLLPIEGTDFFLLMKGSRPEEIVVYDWKEEKKWPLFPSAQPFSRSGKVSSFFTVPGSLLIFLQIDSPTGTKFLRVELKEKSHSIEDLTPFFEEKPDMVLWDPLEKDLLFVLEKQTIHRIDVASRVRNPYFLEGISGYGLSNRTLTVLTNQGLLQRMDLDGKNIQPVGKGFSSETFPVAPGGPFRIEPLSREILLFFSDKGDLWVNVPPFRLIEEGLRGLKPHPHLEKVALWQKDQIGILEESTPDNGEASEKRPVLTWIFDDGKRIEQLFFVEEGSHLLFRDKSQVFLLELETDGKQRCFPVVEVKRKSSIFYSEELGTLYYLDRSLGHLVCLEILPDKNDRFHPKDTPS